MPEWGYLIIAIAILIILGVIFFVSFVLYKKTPLPKGCEDLKIDANKCNACNNMSCPINNKRKDGK